MHIPEFGKSKVHIAHNLRERTYSEIKTGLLDVGVSSKSVTEL